MLLIDARYLAQPPSGIPRYTLNLLHAIQLADPGRPVRILTHPHGSLPVSLANHPAFDIVVDPHAPRSPGELLRWRGRLQRLAPRVIHCPDAFAPLWPGPKVIITLHDAIPLLPELTVARLRSRKEQLRPAWKLWLKTQCRRAHAVFTVSQHSAHDLQRLLHLPPRKLHVLHIAVPPPPTPPLAPHDVQPDANAAVPFTRPYLLCVGRFDPYKNTATLVDAFAQLPRHLHLVFVGPLDPRFPQARQRAEQLGLSPRITFTGSIDDLDLQHLYRHAAALVMPSRYEGFGLPAIEAMHHGVPVVASHAGALPEVVADAALLVDAANPTALAHAIQRVLTEPALCDRLIAAGHRRASHFSLARLGETYLHAVDQIAALTTHASRSTMRR